ncbi:hypothetical protein [Niveispirillum sp. KHB5.9]|uniref:hypothetical protein n=1 Tax=Niveispirillum sp. KHB5.9 TaxID=3400269 RepID=UPI003A8B769B
MSLRATAIDVRFIQQEDRLGLTLRSDDDSVDMLVTRRMTRGLVAGMIELLMRSSREVAAAPGESRNDVLLFEHMEAAAGWQRIEGPVPAADPSGAAAGDGVRQTDAPAALLVKTDITIRQGIMQLLFHDADGARAEIDLGRDKAHHLLSILREKSVYAQWDISEMSWLDRRTHFVIPEGLRLS